MSHSARELLPLHAPVIPFGHNPSAWSQRVPVAILATIGFAIAGYMALYQWGLIPWVWDPFFSGEEGKNGSEFVLTSETSHYMYRWFRVPDAAFGALAYLGDAIFGMAGSTRRWQTRPWIVIIFGFDVIPLGIVSIILVGCQGLVVGYWCFLCLVTAVISLILIYLAYDEVWSCLHYLRRVWRISEGDYGVMWKAFWGFPTDACYRAGDEMVAGSTS
ncbi:vitamin K epoxide reductase family protein [Rubinisphaera margarita]|uniref:vitamin K epoxide reductase family protein n=1 Tax=Rubinisphaera margarita TaxID=2909586 RepID=UPI001EE8C78E|nr:vitamin K epoxide reductase family protein [Rubinisphaera margarita]MCG6158154.1 vitamin K epoxide reductase [Rubinisphaera margarita]